MPRVCVFCGSSHGRDGVYRESAAAVGRLIAARGLGLVYGGGSVGLMGVVADAALASGGEVIGVIPEGLARAEIAHAGLSELHVVPGMHARKAMMASLADAFLALPGGFGTLDELFEIVTWSQLGLHRKPIALLNVAGYFDPLLTFLERAVADGFVAPSNHHLILSGTQPEELLGRLL
jgi:uncharacterized protein (TIGR00730 family)